MSEAQERLNARCEQIKSQVSEVKAQVKSTAKSIVDEAKGKGRSALYRVSEFLGIKKRLLDIREIASIDKLDNLAMNVQLDKEKHMENAKTKEQTEPERAEAERVEAEIVYSPMVAEPQEYQYNADAFEARGVDEVKQEAAHKEVSKVREDKAR